MSAALLFVEGYDDFLEQGAQQFLLVARRRGRCLPGLEQIGAEGKQADALVCAERSWAQLFATRKLGLGLVELAQAVLPLGLDAAGDEAVVGVDSAIATLGALRLVACALDRETPLRQRAVVVGFVPPLALFTCRRPFLRSIWLHLKAQSSAALNPCR